MEKLRAGSLVAVLAALLLSGCALTEGMSSGSAILAEGEVRYPTYSDTNIMIENRSPSVYDPVTPSVDTSLGNEIAAAFLTIPKGMGAFLSMGWISDIWTKGTVALAEKSMNTAYTRIVLGTNEEKAMFEIRGVKHTDGNLSIAAIEITALEGLEDGETIEAGEAGETEEAGEAGEAEEAPETE